MTRSRLHASAAKQAFIIGVSALSLLVAACDDNQAPLPSGPSPLPIPSPSPAVASPSPVVTPPTPGVPDPSQLVVFREPSGFSTTEVRDAQDHIVQFTAGGDLVWMADGTHLPGYAVDRDSSYWGPPTYFISGKICVEGCVFSVRFWTRDGQRQAFLTVDYGHDNPGTLVDVNVVGGALVVRQTALFPPGTP